MNDEGKRIARRMQTLTQAERIAMLETQVVNLSDNVTSMNNKLDDLLALRNKGAGAFWLATILCGTTMVGVVGWLFNYFKGA
jgi:hypothetical protein